MDLFEIPILEDISITDLRILLSNKLKEEKQIEIEPSRIRIREMFSKSPYTIFFDGRSLKESCSCLYNGKSFAIQELEESEIKMNKEDVIPFVIPFFPSKYQLGNRIEIKLREDMTISQLKEFISNKYDIKNVGIAKGLGSWPGPDLLEIPELDWDAPVSNYYRMYSSGTIGTSPLYLKDGDILFIRDNDEELKVLTPEEKKAMEKEANKLKRTSYAFAKEEALTINTKG